MYLLFSPSLLYQEEHSFVVKILFMQTLINICGYVHRMSLIQNESDTGRNILLGNATLLQTGAETL